MKNDHPIRTILIVDGQIENLSYLSKLLSEQGYSVIAVKTGHEALTTIYESLPDLVLLDILLPDIGGFEVCKKLKSDERTRELPVIFLSDINDIKDIAQGFEIGGADYISKPFNAKEVIIRIANQIQILDFEKLLEYQNKDLRYINDELLVEIEERKQTEEDARKVTQELHLILNSIGEGKIATDESGLIVGMNPIAEELTGWAEKEANGKQLNDVFNIIDTNKKLKEINANNKEINNNIAAKVIYPTILVSNNGKEHQIVFKRSLIKTKEGRINGEVIAFSDESENFLIQKELQISNNRLTEKTAELTSLISELESHRIASMSMMEDTAEANYELEVINEELVKEIHDRQKYEDQLKLFAAILGYLNRKNEWQNLVNDIMTEIQVFTGFDAIGIRLRDGNDYPYFVQNGFDESFINKENHLCSYDKFGRIILDSHGNPYLECMCGNIIRGRTDPSKAFFTENGSFWTNSTTKLLSSTSEEDRQSRTRNRCNGEGYESVALIPLRSGEGIIGLLQFNDKKTDRFDLEFIEFFEEVANAIGIAFKRMQSEEKIKESGERYRSVTQSANDAIITADNNGTIIDWNNGAEKIFGYGSEEIIGKKMELIIPQDFKDLHSKGLERIEPGSDYHVVDNTLELLGIHKNRNEVPIELSLSVWQASNGTFYTVIIRDITNRKKADQELIEAKESADEMNRLKTNFLANMSHELRTPMVGILGFSQMLIGTDDLELVNEFAPLINNSGKRLMETLNMILDLSRIESLNKGFDLGEIDLYEEIFQHVTLFQTEAFDKGLNLTFKSDLTNIPFQTDRNIIKSIINNLLSNALKFTLEGEVNVLIFKEEHNSNSWVVIKVQDTGIGIPEDRIDSIFDEFRQVSEGLGRSHEGIGLGLTLTKKYIDLLGGSINLESKVGIGSTFIIKLPMLSNESLSETDYLYKQPFEIENKEEAEEIKSNKILIVEDDNINLELLKRILNGLYEFDYAFDGLESIEKAKNNMYSLILMDINLGVGMTGVEAMQEIRKISAYKNVPIVAVTAYALNQDEAKFLSDGFDYYIPKPYKKDIFLEFIKKILS